jgi:vacuolar-type H+-ATPase subunit H
VTTTTTTESVRGAVEEALEEARDRLGEARERIAPLVADALTAAADKLTPDDVQVRITRRPRAPRWALVAGAALAALGVLVVVSRLRARRQEEWPSYDTSNDPRDLPGEPMESEQGRVDRAVTAARSAVADAVDEASDQLADLDNRPSI